MFDILTKAGCYIAIILLGALLVNRITNVRRKKSYFIIELPEYKFPSLPRAFKSMCSRGWSYIVKAGTIILLCNAIVFVMQSFEGDWHNAADIYRDWFEENKSDDFVKATVNPKLPEWYFDSPIVITYPVRGVHDTDTMTPNRMYPYINAIEHVERLSKETDSRIMVILMHWEGTAPWAPPYVWPPFGGEEELEKFITALHKENHIFGVYCSGLGWTMQSNLIDEYNKSKEFEDDNLKSAMCLAPDGSLPLSKIWTPQRSGYDMCPVQNFTVDIICDQVKKMVDSGIDYIQLMDQNHGGTSYFCYSRNHGHAPVPGRWQVEAVKKLLNKAESCVDKVLFGCESAAAETYLPHLLFRYHYGLF